MWVLADSHNGYFHQFQVYTGREGSGERQLRHRVVKDLTLSLKGKSHHVYFDNFFTSEQLLCELAEVDIYTCGTAQKDRRGFPPTLQVYSVDHENFVKFHKRCYLQKFNSRNLFSTKISQSTVCSSGCMCECIST